MGWPVRASRRECPSFPGLRILETKWRNLGLGSEQQLGERGSFSSERITAITNACF